MACSRPEQVTLWAFTWGTVKLKAVHTVLLRFPGFLETVCSGFQVRFLWLSGCVRRVPNQQEQPRRIKGDLFGLISCSTFLFCDSTRVALHESQFKFLHYVAYTGPLCSPSVHPLSETSRFSSCLFNASSLKAFFWLVNFQKPTEGTQCFWAPLHPFAGVHYDMGTNFDKARPRWLLYRTTTL